MRSKPSGLSRIEANKRHTIGCVSENLLWRLNCSDPCFIHLNFKRVSQGEEKTHSPAELTCPECQAEKWTCIWLNLEKYKKTFWITENISNTVPSLMEWSSETCLPESELPVSSEASNTLGVDFFYKSWAEGGIWNWTAYALRKELNKRKILKKHFNHFKCIIQ